MTDYTADLVSATRAYTEKLNLTKAGHMRLDEVLRDQCRLYNGALQHRRDAYGMAGVSISLPEQGKELTLIRADDPEAAAIMRRVQEGTLQRLDRAFNAFFRRVKAGQTPGFPRFKPASRYRTLTINGNDKVKGCVKKPKCAGGKWWLRVKGLHPMWFRPNRDLPAIEYLVEVRITRTPRRVEAQLVYRVPTEIPTAPTHPVNPVGIDLGVNDAVTTSDGKAWQGHVKNTDRLERLHQKVSGAKKGSNNRRKKVRMLAKESDRNTARRKGWTHQVSAAIVKGGYDFIAAEDLGVKEMLEKRNDALPREVEAGMNREMAAQAWGDLLEKIRYKAESAGIAFVQVDPAYTTSGCSRCGRVVNKAIGEQIHHCPRCGLTIKKSLNSAINILRRGLDAHATSEAA